MSVLTLHNEETSSDSRIENYENHEMNNGKAKNEILEEKKQTNVEKKTYWLDYDGTNTMIDGKQ